VGRAVELQKKGRGGLGGGARRGKIW
jgi:hypothetical protein